MLRAFIAPICQRSRIMRGMGCAYVGIRPTPEAFETMETSMMATEGHSLRLYRSSVADVRTLDRETER